MRNPYLALWFFILISLDVGAQSRIVKDVYDLLPMGKSITYLEDKSNTLGIEEVTSATYQAQFQSYHKDVFAIPVTRSAYWFKITVGNESKEDIWLDINTNNAWYIDFYAPNDDGQSYRKPILTGTMRPLESKAYPSNTFWLPLNKAHESTLKTYYIKVKEDVSFEVPMLVGTIKALHLNKDGNDFLTAGFIGLMLIMLLYNLFLWTMVRDSLYLYYIGYIFFMLLGTVHVNNYSFFDVLPNRIWWYQYLSFWSIPTVLFACMFSIQYLDLKNKLKWAYRLILVEMGLRLSIGLANLFLPIIDIARPFQLTITLTYISILFASYYLVIKGDKAARYYALGWTFVMVSIVLFMITINGGLPFHPLTRNALYFGVGMEALLFSLALGQRFNAMRRDKEWAQKKLIEKEKEELVIQNKLLEKQLQIDQMELEQREVQMFLEQREILRGSIDNLPIFVAMLDKEGKYLVVNKKYEEAFGKNVLEIEGSTYKELLDFDNLRWRKELIEKGLKGEVSEFTEFISFPNGIQFYGYGRFTPVFDEQNQLKFLTIFVMDISPLKEKEQKLEELNITKDKLFSIIAHDLRSPLTTLTTLVNLFNEGLLEEGEIRPLMEELSKNMNYTSQLVDNLLYWAGDQLKGEHLETTLFDLKALVETNLHLFERKAERKKIRLSVDWKTPLYLIFADKNMIDLVLRNLVSNAIKFTSKGGFVKIIVTQKSNTALEVCVSDTGMGIAPEKLERIFSKDLESTNGTENEKGTGLGLMLSKEFVEKNEGKIWVESEVGQGTSFYFTMPIVEH